MLRRQHLQQRQGAPTQLIGLLHHEEEMLSDIGGSARTRRTRLRVVLVAGLRIPGDEPYQAVDADRAGRAVLQSQDRDAGIGHLRDQLIQDSGPVDARARPQGQ